MIINLNEFTPTKECELYLVDKNGNVYSKLSNKLLKAGIDSKGYKHVNFYINGKRQSKLIHKLIAETFIPNPNNKPQVNHIDGNKFNNNVENLEWCTQLENMRHAWKNELYCNEFLKTPVIQMDKNNNIINIFESIKEAEYQTKINRTSISKVCSNKRKTAGGYKWTKQEVSDID